MIKNPTLLRERVVTSESVQMCKRMQLLVSNYFGDEHHVIDVLKQRGAQDLSLAIAELVMEKFGHKPSAVQDPRFGKVRRALAKKREKKLRGSGVKR